MARSHQREGKIWQKKNTVAKVPKTLRNLVSNAMNNENCSTQDVSTTSTINTQVINTQVINTQVINKIGNQTSSTSWMNYTVFGVSNLEDSWGLPMPKVYSKPKLVQDIPLADSWELLADDC
jgi:hypothetical protein